MAPNESFLEILRLRDHIPAQKLIRGFQRRGGRIIKFCLKEILKILLLDFVDSFYLQTTHETERRQWMKNGRKNNVALSIPKQNFYEILH